MKRVLFTLVACLVGISSLMAQSFSLPGYLFGRCPDYSITYDKNDAQEQKDVYICDGNKSVVRIDSYKWNSSSSDWVYDGKTVMENDNQGRTLVAISYLDTIAAIRDRGITVLLIEHDMRLVMKICEHLVVLENGTLIAQGTPDHVRNHPAVIEAYLGSDDSETW